MRRSLCLEGSRTRCTTDDMLSSETTRTDDDGKRNISRIQATTGPQSTLLPAPGTRIKRDVVQPDGGADGGCSSRSTDANAGAPLHPAGRSSSPSQSGSSARRGPAMSGAAATVIQNGVPTSHRRARSGQLWRALRRRSPVGFFGVRTIATLGNGGSCRAEEHWSTGAHGHRPRGEGLQRSVVPQPRRGNFRAFVA
jgi:hypothetical protein